jgi:hypothetical protein
METKRTDTQPKFVGGLMLRCVRWFDPVVQHPPGYPGHHRRSKTTEQHRVSGAFCMANHKIP